MHRDASPAGLDPVEPLADEYLRRLRCGERPTPAEYAARYPELAARILDLFPALELIEEFKPTPGDRAGQAPAILGGGLGSLGDYALLRELGRGGMGIVYEAERASLRSRVALKVMHPWLRTDANYLRRFQSEARSAAKLHHTNIVPVFDYGEQDGVCYYAMQYIEGVGLDRVLDDVRRLRDDGDEGPSSTAATSATEPPGLLLTVSRGLLTGRFEGPPTAAPSGDIPPTDRTAAPDDGSRAVDEREGADAGSLSISTRSEPVYYREVARLGAQVADALDYAHRQGVVHRDIKPSNLLLDGRGNVWVADFGLAKLVEADDLSQSRELVGTLRFMAPERLQGVNDPRGDIYALGATLYELLTLQPAMDEREQMRLLEQIRHQAPRPPRQHDRRIPRDLETLVLKAISKAPADRFATAGELRDELQRFLESRPIRSRPVGVAERLWRWSKRNPVAAAAVGAVAASLVAVAVISVIYANEQSRARTSISGLADRLRDQSHDLAASLAESNRLLALRNFDRGQAAFEKEQIGPGLLWMIESWRSAVASGDPAWRRAARANLAAWQPHHARLRAVLSHGRPVVAAAFSPDGKTLLTGSDDATAQLWDVGNGRPIGQPLPHSGTVFAVTFSPDGKTILTGCRDGALRFWDVANGRGVGTISAHSGEVMAVAFSPDGRTILTGSADRTVRLWDAASHRPVGRPIMHQNAVACVAFSPDGKALLTGGDRTARLWDAATGEPIRSIMNHVGGVMAAVFSPDGQTILTGDGFGMARRWDAATGKPLGGPIPHRLKVRAVAFSPDGKTVLTAGEDKTARLWDAVTDQPIGLPLMHQGPVVAAAFSPDGRSFFTASSDNTVRVWDADPGQPFGLIREKQEVGHRAAFSPDGQSILSGGGRTARRWETATGRIIGRNMHHPGSVVAVAYSPDGKSLITGSNDRSAQLWDAATGRPIGPPLRPEGNIEFVAFRPDNRMVLTGGGDRMARLWDAATGAPLGRIGPLAGSIDGVAFRPDGKVILTGLDNGEVQLWDAATRTPLGPPFPHPGCISSAAFSPDGRAFLTGCEDGAARLWDVESRKLRTAPLLHQAWIWGVAFSPDGKTIATGSRDRTVRLWDAATGMPLGPPIPHPQHLYTVAFSPDGRTLLTAASDGAARLFRTIPELPDDLERVATWAEVLTGLTLDAGQGTISVLDNASWRARRERLERLGGPPDAAFAPRLDPIRYGTDPLARARVLMDRGRWTEAEAAFDEVVRARPYNASSWVGRGEFLVARGRPERACADFARALQLQPENFPFDSHRILLLLALGDSAGLRQAYSELLDRHGAASDPLAANNVAWFCALGPDAVADRDAPVRLAEAAMAGYPAAQKSLVMNTLGAALYRAGRFEASIHWLEEGIRQRDGQSLPQDWAFLALAHHRLGHREEARRWLDRFRSYRASGRQNALWDELEVRILRDEAEAMLAVPIGELPADVFAPPR